MVAMMVGLIVVSAARLSRADWDRFIPKFAVSAIFIWHFIGLGLLSLIGLALTPILLGQKIVRVTRGAPIKVERSAHPSDWNRREFLRFAGAMLPPVFTFSLTGIAMAQLNNIRVRRFVLPIAALPKELDAITIAQVSEMHVGRFTNGEVLQKMVRMVNEMRADLVLLTGDLINDALADLDTGLELTRALEARFGLAIIEGNHDLIENPAEFERRERPSDIPFFLPKPTLTHVPRFPLHLSA